MAITPSVIVLSVVMLHVVAPFFSIKKQFFFKGSEAILNGLL
jgi:hypothetical protein